MFTNLFCSILFSLFLIINLVACDNSANESKKFEGLGKLECQGQQIRNEFIVQWKDGRISKVKNMNQEQFVNKFIKDNYNEILTSEPNYRLNFSDNSVKSQATCSKGNWSIDNINVKKLWDEGITGKDVVIAVTDSGVDINHPALKNRIAFNTGESGLDSNGKDKSNNGIDDDNNGYVDDYYGYDFIDNDNNPGDTTGHGTAVAGVIASEHITFKNSRGSNQRIYGVAPGAKIIPIRFIGSFGADTQTAVNSLKYAVARGAKIINASWGGKDCSSILPNYVKTLEQKNLLFVAASGNEFLDLDNLGRRAPVYPASLNLKNQITVGAIGFFGNKVGFSNYGHNSVELFAPGSEIITLAPNSGNTCYDGTSFAAPIVSGTLALLIEAYPDASLLEIKNLILNNVRSSKNYINLTNGTLDLGNL